MKLQLLFSGTRVSSEIPDSQTYVPHGTMYREVAVKYGISSVVAKKIDKQVKQTQ